MIYAAPRQDTLPVFLRSYAYLASHLETIIANLRRKILRMRRAYRWFFRGELLQGLDHR